MPILHTWLGHRARLLMITTATLLALALLVPPALAHGAHHASTDTDRRAPTLSRSEPGIGAQLAEVRAATARYHDVEVATAAGYVPVTPCVDDEDGAGAMGIHYLNPQLIGTLDPTTPQALLYLPDADGRLRLVGVEYITPGPGELFGLTFQDSVPGQPGLSAMHVWLWQANPAGMFTPYNPNLSCPAG